MNESPKPSFNNFDLNDFIDGAPTSLYCQVQNYTHGMSAWLVVTLCSSSSR
jgi:hypothetical protein